MPHDGETKNLSLRASAILALFLILVFAGCRQADSAESQPEASLLNDSSGVYAEFESELEAIRQGLHIPGMSAAVVQDQQLVWAKGFGYADVERGIPAAADTPYHLASVTKPVGATVLMQLVETGQLDLDTPVSDFGIEMEEEGVTVWHLLTHTSEGIPGTKHIYDGDRYARLGLVISGVTGQSFGERLNERIIVPLEMTDTAPNLSWAWAGWQGYFASLGLSKGTANYPSVYRELARPYQFDERYENQPGSYSLHFSPAAGLLASVTDLAKFDIALDRDELLRPETKEQMFTPAVTNSGEPMIYGLGWYTQQYQDTRLIWHSGGWPPSVSALLLKAPDVDVTFIILANNYNLTGPFPMGDGDVLYSTPAVAFYKYFVFPRVFGRPVPAIDWDAPPEQLVAQLKAVEDRDAREVLERELWSRRKMSASVGDMETADRLVNIHRRAFPEWSAHRYQPLPSNVNRSVPALWPVSVRPDQVLLLAPVMPVWVGLNIAALLILLFHFRRAKGLPRPRRYAWLVSAVLFGAIALPAYVISDYRYAKRSSQSSWRQAVGPTLYSATGNLVAMVLVILSYTYLYPTGDGGPLPVILGMFLVGWLLFRAPVAAWTAGEPYGRAVKRTAVMELGSTVCVLLGVLPVLILLADHLFRNISATDPLYWVMVVFSGIAGALTSYPYQLWLATTGRIDQTESHAAGETRNQEQASPTFPVPGV